MKSASFSSKGFITGSTLMWVFIVSQASLFLMIPLLFLGLHPFIIVAFFIGSIYFGMILVTGQVVYTVDQDGVTKDVTPHLLKNYWKKKAFQFYSWDQIKNFKAGTDADRSYQEFDFLTIHTENGKKLEINTKKGDRQAFKEFEDTFRFYVGEADAGNIADINQPVTVREKREALMGSASSQSENEPVDDMPKIQHTIREKASFYNSPLAKIVTILFIVMIIGLVVMMIAMNSTSTVILFRMLFVLIPGVMYMIYRVYLKKE